MSDASSKLVERLIGIPDELNRYFTELGAGEEQPELPTDVTLDANEIADALNDEMNESYDRTIKDGIGKLITAAKIGFAHIKINKADPQWAAGGKRGR